MNDEVKMLMELLTKDSLFDRDAAEALVHALVDIRESINKIYNQVLPQLVEHQNGLTKEQVLEKLWEIREQFRHIDYHIRDSKITEI